MAGEFTSEVTVIRSTGGVDLEIAPIKDLKLGRGESAALPITIQNAGSEAVDTVGVAVAGEFGLTALAAYRNCLPLEELEGEEGADEGDSAGQGGGLPITGAPTGLVALAGALLLLAGGATAFLFRRRRVITTL
ncbi:LPXTG cell wall anchor domain-containing protein [Actinoplanes solisilvae]|uniref:LPXTG cell wall anchor domain-containing protein n=1 Tax=Actinoplanes solisilvae TaxID=2486853 RepID=UPI0013E359B6|nr:LPXTG cell wall anchor domain-containing protein [Actinoplanes solisilvae]